MDIYYKINLLRLNDASFLRLNPYFDLGLEVDDDYDKNILNMLVQSLSFQAYSDAKTPCKALMGGGKWLAKDGFWLKIVLEGFDDLVGKLIDFFQNISQLFDRHGKN